MKYSVLCHGTKEGMELANRIEGMLKDGKIVKDECCGGIIELVAWPTVKGEMIREGESLLLYEGSVLSCARRFIGCVRNGHRELFAIGWPKNLEITEE